MWKSDLNFGFRRLSGWIWHRKMKPKFVSLLRWRQVEFHLSKTGKFSKSEKPANFAYFHDRLQPVFSNRLIF